MILRTSCPFFVFLYVKYLCLPERRLVIGYIYKIEDCDCRYKVLEAVYRQTKDRLTQYELIRIFEILRVTEEGRPGGNRNRPTRNVCGGNEYEQKKITVLCKIPP